MLKKIIPIILMSAILYGCGRVNQQETTTLQPKEAEFFDFSPIKAAVYDYRKASSQTPDFIIYYFHGQGGSEKGWGSPANGWNSYLEALHQNIIVVALSTGPEGMFLPNPSDTSQDSGIKLIDQVIPSLEKTYDCRDPKRIVMGNSMGGTSGAYVFFNNPALFDSAIFISAGIYDIPFNSNDDEIIEYLNENGGYTPVELAKNILLRKNVRLEGARSILTIQNRYLKDRKEWTEENILEIMKAPIDNSVYISCGRQDGNGLYLGNKRLAEEAAAKGYRVQWESLKGGHGASDREKMESFLSDVLVNK